MENNTNKTLIFTRTLVTDENGNTSIAYWDEEDRQIYTTEDLLHEIPFLLADGYKVKIMEEITISDSKHLQHFAKMRHYEKKNDLLKNMTEVWYAN